MANKVDERLNLYLKDFELDALNKSNDLSSLRQLCQLELRMEKMHKALSRISAVENPRKYKDLMASLKHATNAYIEIQDNLGINRKKRKSEGDESVVSYIERLRNQAHTILEQRLKKLKCPKCNVVVAKYHIYCTEKYDKGSINYRYEPIFFNFKVECSRCGAIVEASQQGMSTSGKLQN